MLFSALYNLVLLIVFILSLPYFFWRGLSSGKYKGSILQRLGLSSPEIPFRKEDKVIWIHTISLGEAKAAASFVLEIKARFPEAKIALSVVTLTGMEEIQRTLPETDVVFYLPLDFSWNMRRLARKIQPRLFILTESDLWYHLLYYVKESGAKTLLVNGKLSERSFHRFSKIPSFFRRLCSKIDLLCLQNHLYYERFKSLGISGAQLAVTGNIKLDAKVSVMDEKTQHLLKKLLGIDKNFTIVAGSTHFPEEDMITTVLQPYLSKNVSTKLIIAPRHPERFSQVAAMLLKKQVPFDLFSSLSEQMPSKKQVVLVDAMGLLTRMYQVADLALVCGSFIDNVGGHNVFEPILYGTPVFFGPHMWAQRELRDLIKSSGAGTEVRLEDLCAFVDNFFSNEKVRTLYSSNCIKTCTTIKGAMQKTLDASMPLFTSLRVK